MGSHRRDEKDYAMPIRVDKAGAWQAVQPTTEWKMPTLEDEFAVASDLYFVNVSRP